MNSRAHIILHGRVQNVSFRYNTKIKAIINGLKGWVKNNSDGTVEIIADGDKEKIKRFISWCNKGPFMASVEDMEVQWLNYKDEFKTFSVRY